MGHHITTKRPSKVTVPERTHPLAKAVFAEMRRQGVTYDELEWRSGVLRHIRNPRRQNDSASGRGYDDAC